MLTQVETADKSMVRRVVVTLARNSYAMSETEIARLSRANPTEVSRTLDNMLMDGLLIERNSIFALNSQVEGIDAWAEAAGEMAFVNRAEGSGPESREVLWPPESRTLEVINDVSRTLSERESTALKHAVLFKFQRLANHADPDGRVPFPGIARLAGPITAKRKIRNIIFLLAGVRISLSHPEIVNAVPWPVDERQIFAAVERREILLTVPWSGTRLCALGPGLGGAEFFAESIGYLAFERRDSEGVPAMAQNGGTAVRVPFVDRLLRETRITADEAHELHQAVRLDFAAFATDLKAHRGEAEPTTVSPPRSAGRAPAQPAVLRARAGDPTPPEPGRPAQPPRLLVARAPSQAPRGSEVSLIVGITRDDSPAPGAIFARLAKLAVAPDGTPVTVTVHAPSALHLGDRLEHTFLIRPDEDPEPVRFGFVARESGLHRIDVMAWAGGTFLAEVSVEISVAVGGPHGPAMPRVAPLQSAHSRPGEATLEVRYTGGHYEFQLRSDVALFPPVTTSLAQAPSPAVEQALTTLRELAEGRRQHEQVTTRRLLRASGARLWNEMVPPLIRDQFWQIRSHMTAFTIATDHDIIPWEILYPIDGSSRGDSFLVERIPVVRRTYGQFRSPTIRVRHPHFVVPSGGPTGVAAEVAAIRNIVGGGEMISTMSAFLELIESGALGATHFACHNTFGADGSRIAMDDGDLEPWMLSTAQAKRALAASQSVIFINACRSAGTAPSYTSMMGWAQQFMAAGAGAFVGTLWAVRSSSSAEFATAFYQSLVSGATLGAAAHAARTAEHEDLLDPTWLAYAVYGDPFALAA